MDIWRAGQILFLFVTAVNTIYKKNTDFPIKGACSNSGKNLYFSYFISSKVNYKDLNVRANHQFAIHNPTLHNGALWPSVALSC